MFHAEFQNHQTICSEEVLFLKFFTIHGHEGFLGHVTFPKEAPREIWFQLIWFQLICGLIEDN